MSLSQRRVPSTRSGKWEAVWTRSARKHVSLQRRNSLICKNPLMGTSVGSCNWTGASFETAEQLGGDDLNTFLGAFSILRKRSISFVMSVCPSVRMEQLGSDWTDFHEIWYLKFFEFLSRKFKFLSNLTRITLLYMKTNIHFGSYLDQFFLEW